MSNASEYDSESDSDEDNDDEVLAVIDDSSDQDSTVESDEADDAREAVVHSKLSRSGRRVGSWMDRFQDSYEMLSVDWRPWHQKSIEHIW